MAIPIYPIFDKLNHALNPEFYDDDLDDDQDEDRDDQDEDEDS